LTLAAEWMKRGEGSMRRTHQIALLVPMVLVAMLVQVNSATAGVITQCGASTDATVTAAATR
jgi:hypothetical protein